MAGDQKVEGGLNHQRGRSTIQCINQRGKPGYHAWRCPYINEGGASHTPFYTKRYVTFGKR